MRRFGHLAVIAAFGLLGGMLVQCTVATPATSDAGAPTSDWFSMKYRKNNDAPDQLIKQGSAIDASLQWVFPTTSTTPISEGRVTLRVLNARSRGAVQLAFTISGTGQQVPKTPTFVEHGASSDFACVEAEIRGEVTVSKYEEGVIEGAYKLICEKTDGNLRVAEGQFHVSPPQDGSYTGELK